MRSVKCDAKALFALSVFLPCMAMAAENTTPASPWQDLNGISTAIPMEQLASYRGGTEVSNMALTNGLVQDTTAINVATGQNSISDGAFAHASGMPIVIQNSGANVLIQNSTIINVQFQ